MDEKNQRRCWLDGLNCPYGNPNGRFDLRPRVFCLDCSKVATCRDDFEEMFLGPDGLPVSVEDWCSKNKPITISSALDCIVVDSSGELKKYERILIRAVVEMLEASKELNPEIYYAKDLERV